MTNEQAQTDLYTAQYDAASLTLTHSHTQCWSAFSSIQPV